MKPTAARAIGLVLFVFVLGIPSSALAQCTQSEAEVWADVIQYQQYRYKDIQGAGGSVVQQGAATRMHNDDYCASYVQSEAWVNPGGTPGINTNGKGEPRWALGYRFGNLWGVHTGDTKHWYVNWLTASQSWQWVYMGSLHSVIDLGAPPEPTEPEMCVASGGQWNYEINQCEYPNCPVIVSEC